MLVGKGKESAADNAGLVGHGARAYVPWWGLLTRRLLCVLLRACQSLMTWMTSSRRQALQLLIQELPPARAGVSDMCYTVLAAGH
jgi:hypothetical protein